MKTTRTKAQKKERKTRALTKTNPNGVNQYTDPDPRQGLCLSYYLDPKSETFSNMLQSALKAGFTQSYAENLMSIMPAWLSESIGDLDFLSKVERNLSFFLDLETKVQAMGAFGPIFEKKERSGTKTLRNGKKKKVKIIEKVPIMVENAKLLGHKKDTTFFVAERIGRSRYKKADAKPSDTDPTRPLVAVQVNVDTDREKYA